MFRLSHTCHTYDNLLSYVCTVLFMANVKMYKYEFVTSAHLGLTLMSF